MTSVGTGLVLGAALSVQFGSAVAALLFPRAGAAGIVSLRLTIAAIVLLLVCRPRLRGHRRDDWLVVVSFGMAMAGMNTLFYQAIDRIPLGPAVTLEVLGPLTLAVITARRAASWLWAALAVAGVVLLGYQGFDRLNLSGAGFALAAGVMWAGYIVFSARTGRRFPKADGLAIAMAVSAVITLPLGVADAGTALLDPVTIGLGAVIALMSSVLPYTFELLALRRIPTSTFAVLMSLGPAIAVLAGFLVLDQRLSPLELVAVALVIVASAGAVRTAPVASRAGRTTPTAGQPATPAGQAAPTAGLVTPSSAPVPHEPGRANHETGQAAHETARATQDTRHAAHKTARATHEDRQAAHETAPATQETPRAAHEVRRATPGGRSATAEVRSRTHPSLLFRAPAPNEDGPCA